MKTSESDKLNFPLTKMTYSFCFLSVVLGNRTQGLGPAKQAFYLSAIPAWFFCLLPLAPFNYEPFEFELLLPPGS